MLARLSAEKVLFYQVAVGSFWLGEAITNQLIIGLTFVAGGMLLVNRKR